MAHVNISFFLEDVHYRIRQKNRLRFWIEETISSEQKTAGAINVILCSDDYLYKMNVEYLQHETLTDIITFDYTEGDLVSGDLFISLERVKENAADIGVKISDELNRVIIHGVLHLCGYGDKTPDEKTIMRSREDFYLSQRPLKLAHPE